MLGTYDSVAISGVQVGKELVGHWANEKSTPVSRQIVAALSPSEPSELSVIHASREQKLIWVWTLQSEFVGQTSSSRDVCERVA